MPQKGKACAGGWVFGRAGVAEGRLTQAPSSVHRGNLAWPNSAPARCPSSFPCPTLRTTSVRGGAGTRAGRSRSPIDQLKPVPSRPHPGLLSADAQPHSSIMDSTLSASSATCRVSRKRGLAPLLPSCGSPSLGNRARHAQPGLPGQAACPQLPAEPWGWPGREQLLELQFSVESLGCPGQELTDPQLHLTLSP